MVRGSIVVVSRKQEEEEEEWMDGWRGLGGDCVDVCKNVFQVVVVWMIRVKMSQDVDVWIRVRMS